MQVRQNIASVVWLFSLVGLMAVSEAAEPKTETWVADEAALLTAKQHGEIAGVLSAHNEKGPGRISVLIVKQLPANATIEKFAYAKINERPAAATEKTDRALLVVTVNDRKMRIETSKALWIRLPDTFCKQVIDQTIVPRFKEKKFFEGISAGISALIKRLNEK